MPGLYTHTTRATGTILTALIYNGDHENHITNQTLEMTDDVSVNAAAMQTMTSPGSVGAESLPTTAAGEIERLRYQIDAIIGGAQWYSAPSSDIASLQANAGNELHAQVFGG